MLKMTPPILLFVGVRFEDESLLYFPSTLEAAQFRRCFASDQILAATVVAGRPWDRSCIVRRQPDLMLALISRS